MISIRFTPPKQFIKQKDNHLPKGLAVNSQSTSSPTSSHQSGFTIIEVVLVLAIAGLIFLMVFIALPALQRNQRDTQRKNDLNLFVDALQRYAANNKGQYPSIGSSPGGIVSSANAPEVYNFALNYLDWPGHGVIAGSKSFADPSTGRGYQIAYTHPSNTMKDAANIGSINYSVNRGCDFHAGSISSAVAVWAKLEVGGVYCVDVR